MKYFNSYYRELLDAHKRYNIRLEAADTDVDKDDDHAFLWFKKAAENNHNEAQYSLACCYFNGKGVEKSYKCAFEWHEKAAINNNAKSINWLNEQYTLFFNVNFIDYKFELNNDNDFKWIDKPFHLTPYNIYGKNYIRWHTKAVENGFAVPVKWINDIFKKLIKINFHDDKFIRNNEISLVWLTKAAEHGIAEAQYQLAQYYFNKNNRDINYSEDVRSLFKISGDKNLHECMLWLKESAIENNYPKAIGWLTEIYLSFTFPYAINQKEIEAYYQFAFKWCANEIEQGHLEANFYLGILYAFGKGIDQNDDLAFKHLSAFETADKKLESLQNIQSFYIASCYAQGKGVEKNWEFSESFFKIILHRYTKLSDTFVDKSKTVYTALIISLNLDFFISRKDYDVAKKFIEVAYEKNNAIDRNFKKICLTCIEQAQELNKKKQCQECKC